LDIVPPPFENLLLRFLHFLVISCRLRRFHKNLERKIKLIFPGRIC
jgi:hypothetical protein